MAPHVRLQIKALSLRQDGRGVRYTIDKSGRIRKGPAPENLPVPEASFVSESVIKLG